MRLTKKTVFIGIASLLILGLASWGVNLFLVMNNAQKSFDKILFTFKLKVMTTKLLLHKASEKKKHIIYPTLLLRRPLK